MVDLTEGAHVERDTLLVKVRVVDAQRDEVKRTAEIFRGQIIDVGPTTLCGAAYGALGKARFLPAGAR